jgi:hypothetical protein
MASMTAEAEIHNVLFAERSWSFFRCSGFVILCAAPSGARRGIVVFQVGETQEDLRRRREDDCQHGGARPRHGDQALDVDVIYGST